LFEPRKNKTFNRQSVFPKKNEIDTGLDETKQGDFISRWKNNRGGSPKVRGVMSLPILILVLVLLLICMYILDIKFK